MGYFLTGKGGGVSVGEILGKKPTRRIGRNIHVANLESMSRHLAGIFQSVSKNIFPVVMKVERLIGKENLPMTKGTSSRSSEKVFFWNLN